MKDLTTLILRFSCYECSSDRVEHREHVRKLCKTTVCVRWKKHPKLQYYTT